MTNDTPITITLTRIDLCNLALACTNARQHAGDAPGASKWTLLHDTIMAEIIAADEADQDAPAAEAEQQPTETENAPQAATQAAEGTNEKKEAETMTTTEREALERINARQNAANLFTNIGPADIAAELAAMEAEQTTTNEQIEEDNTMSTTERAATATEAATVAGIIRRKGGYRERDILNHPHTIERGTWTTEHKVVEILATTPDPDGYRAGCAVDIVTRAIVG